MATRMPAAPKPRATAAPIPRLEPVIRHALPARSAPSGAEMDGVIWGLFRGKSGHGKGGKLLDHHTGDTFRILDGDRMADARKLDRYGALADLRLQEASIFRG